MCNRSFIGKCLLYGAAFHLWSSFVLIRFDDDTDDVETTEISEKKELPTSQRDQRIGKEEEDDEEPIFIPLSWSRVQEGELYTASDPEYQAAVKILRDAEQTDRLKG